VKQASESAISFGFSFNLYVPITQAVDKEFSVLKESMFHLDLSGYQQKRLCNRKL